MRIRGYAATWNRPFWPSGSLVPVVLRPGAFAAQLATTGIGRVRILMYHDTTRPVGRVDVLREDDRGLYFEARLADTRDGQDAAVLIRDGVLAETSIGFAPIEYVSDEAERVLIVTRAELIEISLVTWGANSETTVQLATDAALRRRLAIARAAHIAVRWRCVYDNSGTVGTTVGAPR